jgi:TnpA family transposase
VATGVRPARQLSQKFAAYPRQHDLAVALHAIGRVERKLCIVECQLDADRLCRAQIGLKKGGAHHAPKKALRIGRLGEIRARTTEGQHFRRAGFNLLAAIII